MIESMTGYGKSELILPEKKVVIELRTLNSKSLDIQIKMPSCFREKELTIREILSTNLYRGKIELFIKIEQIESELPYNININLAEKYHKQIKKFQNKIGSTENIISTVFKLPDLIEKKKLLLNGNNWGGIKKSLLLAIKQVKAYREKEGNELSLDITKRIKIISKNLVEIKSFTKERRALIKDRLVKKLKEIELTDENRLEQELIYYLEKYDITEEQVRLKTHLQYFEDTINESVSQGKKLGFIGQEIGREINTIGAKASNSEIQIIVVNMKNELEKIKEQLMNIL